MSWLPSARIGRASEGSLAVGAGGVAVSRLKPLTRRLTFSSSNSERKNPTVCRSGNLKTMPIVSEVSIAWSEYSFWRPRFRFFDFAATHLLSSSSAIQTVRLPRFC